MWAALKDLIKSQGSASVLLWVTHQSLVGKQRTEAAGEYPVELANIIAKNIVATWKRDVKLGVLETQVGREARRGIGAAEEVGVERGEEDQQPRSKENPSTWQWRGVNLWLMNFHPHQHTLQRNRERKKKTSDPWEE